MKGLYSLFGLRTASCGIIVEISEFREVTFHWPEASVDNVFYFNVLAQKLINLIEQQNLQKYFIDFHTSSQNESVELHIIHTKIIYSCEKFRRILWKLKCYRILVSFFSAVVTFIVQRYLLLHLPKKTIKSEMIWRQILRELHNIEIMYISKFGTLTF